MKPLLPKLLFKQQLLTPNTLNKYCFVNQEDEAPLVNGLVQSTDFAENAADANFKGVKTNHNFLELFNKIIDYQSFLFFKFIDDHLRRFQSIFRVCAQIHFH